MFHPGMILDEAALHTELLPSEAGQVNLFVAAHSDRWRGPHPRPPIVSVGGRRQKPDQNRNTGPAGAA